VDRQKNGEKEKIDQQCLRDVKKQKSDLAGERDQEMLRGINRIEAKGN